LLTERARRRFAPILLVAAMLGAYAMIERDLPHERDVVLDLGDSAIDVTSVEVAWIRTRGGVDEAELTTQWHFAQGAARATQRVHVRLPDGEWEALVALERPGREPAHWSGRVNLERTSWWKRDNLKEDPVILPVREALR